MTQSEVMGVCRIQRRRGSVTVLALMVWMLLMLKTYQGETWRVRPDSKLISDLGSWLTPDNVELVIGS